MARSLPRLSSFSPVSVLFSEPKIPQFDSSAFWLPPVKVSVLFSEPKIPQSPTVSTPPRGRGSFSALQRAENSSIQLRKGLRLFGARFSALQRAENSSISEALARCVWALAVSVLFSEPKIPQCSGLSLVSNVGRVSVLFSEPKIPQWVESAPPERGVVGVSVLFSEPKIPQFPRWMRARALGNRFQCSSASRKFLN